MALNMKELHCVMFQFTMKFDAKQFKAEEFRKLAKCKDDDHQFFVLHFNSKYKTKKEHAHLEIAIDGKDSYLEMSFHPSKLSDEDGDLELNEMPIEDVFSELAHLFTESEFDARVISQFNYNENYESLLQINYPVLVKDKRLNKALVSGHEISLSDVKVKSALISSSGNGLNVILGGKITIVPTTFNYHNEIKHFAEFAEAFVTKRD